MKRTSRPTAGGHPEIARIEHGVAGTFWFPAQAGTLEDVVVTVHWSPYDHQLHWWEWPFRPGMPLVMRPVQYPGRSWAATRREAARMAEELFRLTVPCLRLDHDDCSGRCGDWPEAPACRCSCHGRIAHRGVM
jgi:hypothetical protein